MTLCNDRIVPTYSFTGPVRQVLGQTPDLPGDSCPGLVTVAKQGLTFQAQSLFIHRLSLQQKRKKRAGKNVWERPVNAEIGKFRKRVRYFLCGCRPVLTAKEITPALHRRPLVEPGCGSRRAGAGLCRDRTGALAPTTLIREAEEEGTRSRSLSLAQVGADILNGTAAPGVQQRI